RVGDAQGADQGHESEGRVMDLKIGPDGDLVIEDGELVFAEAAEAVGQHIAFRLRTALGESPYAPLAGTPWLQTIFKTGTPLESVQFILERRVAGTPGVVSAEVDAVELDAETREAVI